MRPISASSIELWNLCRRRWAFRYLAGLETESGQAAEAGKWVHALLEKSKDNEPPLVALWNGFDISRMARALHKHNPLDEGAVYEGEFVRTLYGLPFKGFVDRRSPKFILDYKTTGGSLDYAKTPGKLKKDVQRLIYSEAYPEVEAALWVTGTWGNSASAVRRGDVLPFATQTALLARDEKRDVDNFLQYVLMPAEAIASVATGTDPFSFPLPTDALAPYNSPCQKFPPEGCPHFTKCHKSKNKSLRMALSVYKEPTPDVVVEARLEPVEPAPPAYLIDTLYLDCMPLFPTETPLVFGARVMADAAREVEADTALPHVMLADFGKGSHMLAVEMVAQLELLAPVAHFVLETKSAEGRGVMQSLMGRSRQVIKGMF